MVQSPEPQVRNPHFVIDDVPRHWHGGRRSITRFFDNLSLFFPAGERFFIASVRAHQGFVKGAELERDVRAFCAQEGAHLREHTRYNRRLGEQGLPIPALLEGVDALLARTTRWASPLRQLAVTCALEHFTAALGHVLLVRSSLLDGAHPEMAGLWRWHAMEETEHKAVAFDVYRAAGGGYFRRASAMSMVTLVFWLRVVVHQIVLMRADGCLFSPREWLSLWSYLFVEPGGMFGVWRRWLDYYRPSFHPWDHDDRELLEAHVREFRASSIGGA